MTLGRKIDPKTGKSKINQKTITVRGTKQQAEAKLAELLNQYNKGEYIDLLHSLLANGFKDELMCT